jgi:hypothetical protein
VEGLAQAALACAFENKTPGDRLRECRHPRC